MSSWNFIRRHCKLTQNNTNTVYFDLDGTIVNPQMRLYSVFSKLTDSDIGYSEYWKYKDEGYDQQKMLNLIGYKGSYQIFKRRWLDEIEKEPALEMDELYDDVKETLLDLDSDGYSLTVVTNRQSYEGIVRELENFGILDCFKSVVTTYQRCSKDKAITDAGYDVSSAVFVGDSKEDMDAAKSLGVKGILVCRNFTSGCLGEDTRINSLRELRGLLH